MSLNCALVFVLIMVLKLQIFANQVRPSVYFEGKQHLDFVQGVEILRYNSFPSGHTAAAFAFCFMLSLLFENKKWSVLLFLTALLVGISRMYLLEHFFRDVFFGSIVGMSVTTLFYLTFVRSDFYQNIKWKDKALLQ
jgi:membrane-associated phospholipid phosphatase